MDERRISFTAADSFPLKLCINPPFVSRIAHGYIAPIHIRLIPTNRCNLNCKFCSCSARNKNDELSIGDISTLAQTFADLGTQAVTITGGGEPLMHPEINAIIQIFVDLGIEVGLVSNGELLGNLTTKSLNNLTWCRIFCSDERHFTLRIEQIIREAVFNAPNVDWAFSYVAGAGGKFSPSNLSHWLLFANEHNFTHVRVVSDLLNVSNVSFDQAKKHLQAVNVDSKIVIWQERKEFQPGKTKCHISLLKHVIGADGYIYPCCGVQYAHQEADLDMPTSMRMGHWSDTRLIYLHQATFKGDNCAKCYYTNYNELIGDLLADIAHKVFV